jgi:hypothetical protein
MRIKILSGNQTGAIVEMRPDEAEVAIHSGYGEVVTEPVPEPKEKAKPKAAKAAKKGKRG